MGKKAIAILLFAGALCMHAVAQKDSAKGFVHKGLLRAGATYSLGVISYLHISNVYLNGNLEYYTDNKISVRGDGCYFFNSLNESKLLKMNHQLFFGACYNFPVAARINPFIGLQPGIAYIQTSLYGDPASFSPLASVITGFNYYAEKWFHIMVNVRYVVGQHLDEVSLFNVNEISFAFGLGFDLDVLKKNK